MVSCSAIQLLLGPFDDGELEPHEMEDVALHVVSCTECKAALEDYRYLGVALRRVSTVPVVDLGPAVMARIEAIPIPWSRRIREFIGSFGRIGTAVEVMSVAAVTALLTVMVMNPAAQHLINGHNSRSQANQEPGNKPGVQPTLSLIQPTPSGELASVRDAQTMQELVSQMGAGDSPSVAVWNEPKTNTTVVWVPDQP